MPTLAVAARSGALLVRAPGPVWPAAAGVLAAGGVVVAWRVFGRVAGRTALAAFLVAGAVATSAGVRAARVGDNPLAGLARADAGVTLVGTVVSDPRLVQGRFADEVMVRVEVSGVRTGATTFTLREPVLVFGSRSWATTSLGAVVEVSGRLSPAGAGDVAAIVSTDRAPAIRAGPDPWWRASGRMRQALRDSAARLSPDRRVLVPALVDGDDAGLDPALVDDFRATGLTHLLAVSGTNLTLVVGFLLMVARRLRVRGRWLHVVAALGIAGFVLLARAEPSVLRAAAMGTVALIGLGSNGVDRGTRALGVATVGLLLVDPGLASSVGFALSAMATAGILLLAPGWRDALGRWLPRWLAEAIAVPAAAQLACTPLIAAISGQVSLVAVAANLVAAPAVGPATVLGLAGGALTLVWTPLGRIVASLAGWCVAWIVTVARHGAAVPTAAVAWGQGPVALAVLAGLSLVVALGAPRLLRRRTTGAACAAVLTLAVLVRVPTPGWPPAGWLMVMCDVGQGDGLVLNTGLAHTAVVVDAGPDPRLMDRCLTGLGIRRVPLVVLTHFHADHVDGLPGVLSGRRVDAIEVTRLADPPEGVALVRRAAAAAGLRPALAPYARTRRIGALELEPVWPLPDSPTLGPGDGSTANNASVVILARIRGVTIFLGGDVEPEGQATLAAMLPGLRVDVLKVPHHGSRYQDLPFLRSLRARLALISVGADNDYGHPAAETVSGLAATGERVLRTDLDGSIAVVERGGRLSAVTTG
jgi:competence protein ComEC